MPAEPLEMLGAGGQAAVQVERPVERPEPFQFPSAPAISTTGRW